MLKIKLRRMGAKRQPSYRIVIAEARTARDGEYVEVVGFYNPRTQPETITVKEERVWHWLKNGAQPTESVARLLTKTGTLERFARFKAGEAPETLLAEAAEAEKARATSPKTRLLAQ